MAGEIGEAVIIWKIPERENETRRRTNVEGEVIRGAIHCIGRRSCRGTFNCAIPCVSGLVERALYVGDQLSKAKVMINAKYVEDGYDPIVEGLDRHTTELYRECGFVSY